MLSASISLSDVADQFAHALIECQCYGGTKEVAQYDAVLVGTSTYHHYIPGTIKNYFEEVAVKSVNLKNKVGAAFGSYGWSGKAPRLVVEILKNRFGMNITEPPFLAKYTPDQESLEKCFALGKKIAESLIRRE